ncbi:hypothetical protein LTR36_005822 [Oleoguttula mirabilis]|uniref:Amino acid transporter n=1 Tax=Oleoguttula mirabilis TaxID=1507867 RepID=A0AAV9JD46_9PEZI|nr:hypothetical protein LTR36_005822 [Oleoguttula mirabilis]
MYRSVDDKMKKDSTLQPLDRFESRREGVVEDTGLDVLGLQSEIQRDMSPLAIISVGWNITNSWAGIAATMALSIASGGTVTLIYGLIVVLIVGGLSAASLAEIASVYPTAGGQYHWTSILAPKKWSRGLVSTFGLLSDLP